MKVTLVSADIRYREPLSAEDYEWYEDYEEDYQTEWVDIPVNDINRNIGDLVDEVLKDDSYDDAIEFCFGVDTEPGTEYWLSIDGFDRWWSIREPGDAINYDAADERLPAKQYFVDPLNHTLGDALRVYGKDLINYVKTKQGSTQAEKGV